MNEKNRIRGINRVFLCTVFTSLLASLVTQLMSSEWGVSITEFQAILVSQVVLILPALAYIILNKINVVSFIRLNKIRWMTVLQLVLFAFMVMPLMNLISCLSLLVFENHIVGTVQGMVSNTNFFLCFMAIAVIPAVLEEAVYRGVFFSEYSKYNVRKGIVLSALMFGLLHMNMNQFLYAFAMGIVFALVIEATGSIVSSMIIHLTINGWSLLLTKLQEVVQSMAENQPELFGKTAVEAVSAGNEVLTRGNLLAMIPSLAVSAIFCSIIAGITFYFIAKGNGRLEHVKKIFARRSGERESNISFLSPALIFAVAVCFYCMLVNG